MFWLFDVVKHIFTTHLLTFSYIVIKKVSKYLHKTKKVFTFVFDLNENLCSFSKRE